MCEQLRIIVVEVLRNEFIRRVAIDSSRVCSMVGTTPDTVMRTTAIAADAQVALFAEAQPGIHRLRTPMVEIPFDPPHVTRPISLLSRSHITCFDHLHKACRRKQGLRAELHNIMAPTRRSARLAAQRKREHSSRKLTASGATPASSKTEATWRTTIPFLALPPEMRLLIYEFIILPRPQHPWQLPAGAEKATSLLNTCRTIRHELLYAIHRGLHLIVRSIHEPFPTVYARHVRKIVLTAKRPAFLQPWAFSQLEELTVDYTGKVVLKDSPLGVGSDYYNEPAVIKAAWGAVRKWSKDMRRLRAYLAFVRKSGKRLSVMVDMLVIVDEQHLTRQFVVDLVAERIAIAGITHRCYNTLAS